MLKICLLKKTQRQWTDRLALFLSVLLTLFCLPVVAAATEPKIVLIIDDIGHRDSDHRALELPKEVTFSILPDAPLTKELSELAHAQGRDIMLHMPMESFDGQAMGPDGLKVGMYEAQMEALFERALNSVPYAIGVNNHMGSRLTSLAAPMHILMAMIKTHNLFFIDSRTSPQTVAEEAALSAGIPAARRHVFLDHERTQAAMEREYKRLLVMARQQGVAVAIAHPHPATLRFLQSKLPNLQAQGIRLATVSDLFSPRPSMMAERKKRDLPLAAPK
ncbi:divergent polysaccharide deacetylase family protein [Alteromonas sp. C1M14]|uniref:divergent polysaccharide deacetylase family protein n=1 Tax=Alteromonas sp. C1M14 TaxID=2841567 RepID=UPI001C085BC3|nr:divergent polysaccharide deacetylase family protein [Alteromonas sp. C1M14]MBU2978673.1 divergent polysaccharide deacetylase family protein [Alteromonas sp. C1M14]